MRFKPLLTCCDTLHPISMLEILYQYIVSLAALLYFCIQYIYLTISVNSLKLEDLYSNDLKCFHTENDFKQHLHVISYIQKKLY